MTIPHRVMSIVSAIIGCLLVGGCSYERVSESIVSVRNAEAWNADIPLALDVSNRLGTVAVEVNPRLKAPFIDARWIDGTRQQDPVTRLPEGPRPRWLAADVVVQGDRATLRVLHADADDKMPSRRLAILIRVPRCDGIRVRNRGGAIDVSGVAGAIDIENSFGRGGGASVRVRTDRDIVDPVSIATSDGDIEVRFGSGSTGRIRMESARGDIRVVDSGGRVRAARETGVGFEGTVNGGDTPFIIRNGDGAIVFELGR